jgi:hypothetical protein
LRKQGLHKYLEMLTFMIDKPCEVSSMETVDNTAVQCPNCGAFDTGTFCSACGAALQETPRHAYREFLDTFLKLGDLKHYLIQYGTLLRSPVRNTLDAFEKGHLHGALRFAEWSLALYALLVVSNVVVLRTQEWIAALLLTLMTVMSWSVGLWTHYLLVRKKATIERSFRAYLTLSCLYIGFVIPPLSIATWMQSFWPTVGLLLLLALLVLVIVYAVQVWTPFWALPGKTVLGYFALSGLAGTAASYAFAFVVFSLFPGSRFGLFAFDGFLSVDTSQLFDPYVHAQINDLVPYTHPAEFFEMETPAGWTVATHDSLDEHTVAWVAPYEAALVRVHIFPDETDGTDEALVEQIRRRIPDHLFLTVEEAVREAEGEWRVPFSYFVYATNWMSKPAPFTTQGQAYGSRHGDAILVFMTLLPTKLHEKLKPQLTRIRQSLTVGTLPATWTQDRPPSQDILHAVEITDYVRHTHPAGLYALDVPDTWTGLVQQIPDEDNIQWTDPHQNGIIFLKIVLDESGLSDADLFSEAQAFVQNTFGANEAFTMAEPARETDDRVRVGFAYTYRPWLGLGTIPPALRMSGETCVERRGVFIVVFSTLVPADQQARLAPAFAHIRNSLVLNQMALW